MSPSESYPGYDKSYTAYDLATKILCQTIPRVWFIRLNKYYSSTQSSVSHCILHTFCLSYLTLLFWTDTNCVPWCWMLLIQYGSQFIKCIVIALLTCYLWVYTKHPSGNASIKESSSSKWTCAFIRKCRFSMPAIYHKIHPIDMCQIAMFGFIGVWRMDYLKTIEIRVQLLQKAITHMVYELAEFLRKGQTSNV